MTRTFKKICLIAALTLIPALGACVDPIVGPDFGERTGEWLDQGWW